MIWIRFGLIGLLLICAVAFVITFTTLNSEIVDVHLVFIELHQVKMEVVLIWSFILGGLLGVASGFGLLMNEKRKLRKALKLSK